MGGTAKVGVKQSQKGLHPLIKPYRPKVFEAFAGCGGMTIGFTRAGFDVQRAVEIMIQQLIRIKNIIGIAVCTAKISIEMQR